MSETPSGSSSTGSDEELDDPGRDPVGLNPPRNVLFGSTQDTGQGRPSGEGNVGPGDKPEDPTEEPESRADESEDDESEDDESEDDESDNQSDQADDDADQADEESGA